jgi:hypothetical protein
MKCNAQPTLNAYEILLHKQRRAVQRNATQLNVAQRIATHCNALQTQHNKEQRKQSKLRQRKIMHCNAQPTLNASEFRSTIAFLAMF